MISHTTVPTLLDRHGHTLEGRRAAREEIAEVAVEAARQEARLCGLSINCQEDIRAEAYFGRSVRHRCRNSGDTCLCACHDPAGPATQPEA